MRTHNFNLGYLSTYRTELMGFSALLILICHSIAYIKFPLILHYTISLGNIGVDLFLFLSGMGIWNSLTKSNNNVYKWYANRYKKLFVPYLVVLLSIELIQFALGKHLKNGIWNYIFGLSSLRFYVSHDAAWFIAALIPLYLFAPWFYRLINKYRWMASILLIITHYIILFIPSKCSSDLINNIIDNIQFVAVRATCFILGMSLGKYIQKGEAISVWWLIGSFIMGLIIIVITQHLVYGYFFFTLPLLIVVCLVFQRCGKWLKNFSCFMGKISLESYILNGSLPQLIISAFVAMKIPTAYNIFPYIIACILGTFLAYGFHKISDKILNHTYFIRRGKIC